MESVVTVEDPVFHANKKVLFQIDSQFHFQPTPKALDDCIVNTFNSIYEEEKKGPGNHVIEDSRTTCVSRGFAV